METVKAAPKTEWRAGIAVFALALVTALAWTLIGWKAQGLVTSRDDPYYFGAMGRSWAHGEGFAAYGLLLKRRSPLYPLFIGVIYRLFGDNSPLLQAAQALMFAVTAWLAFDSARRVFNLRTGIIAGLLCAVHPVLLRYVPDFHLETMFTFLVTLTVWGSVRLVESPSWRSAAVMGVSAGLGALVKSVILPYPALFAIGWVWTQRRRGRNQSLKLAAAMLGCMALTILPWTIRNLRVTGHFVPITTGLSDAFLRGYIFSKPEYATLKLPPYTYAEIESNNWFKEICARSGAVWEADDLQTDRLLNQAAKEKLVSDPAAFVRKFVTGLFTFWYEMTSRVNSIVTGVPALIALVFALIGWRRARSEGRPAWLFLLPVIYMNLLLAALLSLGRYSVPILPSLLIVAAYGVDSLLGGTKAGAPANESATAEAGA